MAKLQESKGRYSLTLSTKIVKLMKWEKGDKIELETDLKGRLYLVKKEV
jgi:hypothetical protein